jgi:hypothetical protein
VAIGRIQGEFAIREVFGDVNLAEFFEFCELVHCVACVLVCLVWYGVQLFVQVLSQLMCVSYCGCDV